MKDNENDKTISFEDKKQLKYSTQKQTKQKSQQSNSNNSNKIISYGINKKKKKAKTILFKNKSPITLIFILAIICLISASINNNLPDNKNKHIPTFKSINPTVSQTDFANYATKISISLKDTLNLKEDSRVVTESMHKNGNKLYAQGYFFLDKYKQIYFDITLEDDSTTSLIVNGIDYTNKEK